MFGTRVRRGGLRAILWLGALPGLGSCGARSEPLAFSNGIPLEGGLLTACIGDLDCGPGDLCSPAHCIAGKCVVLPPVDCDDRDDCTDDRCVPETGACEHKPLTFDLDGDGHRAPR